MWWGALMAWRIWWALVSSCIRLKYQPRFAMPSILVIVFFLQLAIHLVNTVGAQAINDLVPSPRTAFPTYYITDKVH